MKDVKRVAAALKRHTQRYCNWEEVLEIGLEACAIFLLTAVRLEDESLAKGIRPDQMEGFAENRLVARQVLEDWLIIPEGTSHLTPLDHLGRDVDLRRFIKNCNKQRVL